MNFIASDMNPLVSKVCSQNRDSGEAREEKHNSPTTGPKYVPVPEVEVHRSHV